MANHADARRHGARKLSIIAIWTKRHLDNARVKNRSMDQSSVEFDHAAEEDAHPLPAQSHAIQHKPSLIAADFEGVFIPEIWIAVAEKTGISDLRVTTRDIADYAELMAFRMDILDKHNLRLPDIQAVIGEMEPLSGAHEFCGWIRRRSQFIVLTDSFYQFVQPFLPKLDWPTIFAHQLFVDDDQRIIGYELRVPDSKRRAIEAFRAVGFRTMAFGDSYNDTTMLTAADRGALFRPPANVIEAFPQFPVTTDYGELRVLLADFLGGAA